MQNVVYILYSPSIDKFYVGETVDIDNRICEHNSHFFTGSFTTRATDWQIFLTIECSDRRQARLIESHIKRMKSTTYIKKLKLYPDVIARLLEKYKTSNC